MEQSLFDRLPAMDGKIVTSNVVMPQTKLDLGACSFHCLGNPKCKAFFHHKETSLCQLQAAKGSGGKAEKGWLHYYKKSAHLTNNPCNDKDEDDDSDDEDDTAELLAELNIIKKERASERAKMDADRKQEEERIRTENILRGNPLINKDGEKPVTEFKVKRRWDDDVVFKNCAKGEEEPKTRGFVNDTLRSEFHKKFIEKYVK
ncbi:protein CWC15 homolog [Haliotis cracherodii]|uniref:protein CWC15 homolog n=1 Tax=Haliotis cracherodii TaxID=6455 RepID=UPI0039E8ACE0